MSSNAKNIIIVVVLVAILALGYVFWPKTGTAPAPANTSSGGQANSISTAGWKQYSDSKATFLYPEKLNTQYIGTVDWPPKAQILDQVFDDRNCIAAGKAENPAGQTEPIKIGNVIYCRTVESQGAAGSMYSNYAYAFPVHAKYSGFDTKTAILTFSLRFPQCMNYPDPKQSECLAERNSFDINGIVDAMAKSLQLK